MLKKIKSLKNLLPIIPIIIWMTVITVIFLLLVKFLYPYLNFLDSEHKEPIIITAFYGVSLIILTFSLVCVAWFQLALIRKQAKADFLLRIDNRYGSKSIIKARSIIHRIYIHQEQSTCKHIQDKVLSEKIVELYWDKESYEDFICLLNFLDFLETIAYFSNNDHVDLDEIEKLLGGSLIYFYKIFTPLINFLRVRYEDNDYFNQIETLIKERINLK
jgi:hypothetical protein